jgi:hypothetical protein
MFDATNTERSEMSGEIQQQPRSRSDNGPGYHRSLLSTKAAAGSNPGAHRELDQMLAQLGTILVAVASQFEKKLPVVASIDGVALPQIAICGSRTIAWLS